MDQFTFPDGMTVIEYCRLYLSHTPIVCVPVPPLVLMPSDEKLTMTGLPITVVTDVGKVLSLITGSPDEGATADM